ncbi:MAG: hypothetical protein LBB59_04685 [Campylobacteraceae bacterium]|jgi:hypothetical protein|nr:hypothetical protein [Campylobacteraceae bacterium]
MDMYLQFGHGMTKLCCDLVEKCRDGTVILSPRDLSEKALKEFSFKLTKINGKTLFDPQYYNPKANHKKLIKHPHWLENCNTSLLSDFKYIKEHIERIKTINDDINSSAYIIPSIVCSNVDNAWIKHHEIFLNMSDILRNKERFITLALKKEVLENEDDIETLIRISSKWDVDGYYIVPESPYLNESGLFLSNLGLLVAGLKLQNRKVIIGYANHQMLYLACTKADAIASGTFLNVRSFNTNKFNDRNNNSISRRATWYYCPQAFSEYRISILDTAQRENVLDEFRPYGELNEYSKDVFLSSKPSESSFSEKLAFKHYLFELRKQCLLGTKKTFNETVVYHEVLIKQAIDFLRSMNKHKVYDSMRCFNSIVDGNIYAINKIKDEIGLLLEANW